MPAKAHQVLYVPRRGSSKTLCALYIEFTQAGRVKKITTEVPRRTRAPWLKIQKKEYLRLCEAYDLKRTVGRPVLSDDERREHKRQSGEKYRKKIARLREELDLPLTPVERGQRAPDNDVARVMELLGTTNPDTGKAYTGVEIGLIARRSQSFVSRVKNGQRRAATVGQ